MSVSPQPGPSHGQMRKFGMSRIDDSALDMQEPAVEIATDLDAQDIDDLDITEKRVAVRRTELAEEHQGQMPDYQQNEEAAVKAPEQKWISFAIRVIVTLLLFTYLFKKLSCWTLLAALRHVHPAVLPVAVVVGLFSLVVSAYQWQSLLHSERIHFDLAKLINLYLVGMTFSHFLPTGMGGDVVKAFYVGRDSGNSAGSASAVVMSRVTGFFGMMLVAFPALIIWHTYFTRNIVLLFVLLSLGVGSMIAGAIVSARLLPGLFKGKWAKRGLFASAIRIGDALSMSVRRPRSLGVATLFGILFHVVACLNYYSFALALGIDVPLHFYFVAIPLVSLAAFLPISINGFGVRESAFVYVFSTIHVAVTTSLLLAFLVDVQVLIFAAIGGCIYLTMGSQAPPG